MPSETFGWRWRRGWAEATPTDVKTRAKEMLARATKGTPWISRCGVKHIPLIVEGIKIGELREDVDLKSVEIGAYRIGRGGMKVQLLYGGRVVGFITIPMA